MFNLLESLTDFSEKISSQEGGTNIQQSVEYEELLHFALKKKDLILLHAALWGLYGYIAWGPDMATTLFSSWKYIVKNEKDFSRKADQIVRYLTTLKNPRTVEQLYMGNMIDNAYVSSVIDVLLFRRNNKGLIEVATILTAEKGLIGSLRTFPHVVLNKCVNTVKEVRSAVKRALHKILMLRWSYKRDINVTIFLSSDSSTSSRHHT